ncbi:hypothetical protein QBC37DRAFT_323066 [Rhypophila decipiens]|uniref:Uncharacterized protein n=1 Tax=Rhypophila decipiens TaxID=261697 RepID=A0AAN6Y4I8_9PEZI|nr:hypothetical protein QBC37DRAFT_323066 [Rhypophila decipiens]
MSDMALNKSDLPSAIEIDITDYHRPPSAYTQSNEELLAADTHPDPNEDSASENAASLTDAPTDVSAANPPPIRLELAAIKSSRTTIERVPTISNPSGFTSPRNGDEFLQVSTWSRQGVSEDDIELDDFAVTCAGTHSTDNLVPLPSEVAELVDRPQPQKLPHNSGTPDRVESRTVPNYKPAPLRWPFQLLLVAMIAAMFGFLEYQVHDLPPPRYKALQLDLKEGSNILPTTAATGTPTARPITTLVIQATPLPKGSAVVATETHIQTSEDGPYMLVNDRRLRVRKPLKLIPAPTPRPESSEYPSPPGVVTAYCGWNRPKWFQDVFIMNRPEWAAISTFAYISEQISMFTTTDPSWCPCTITKGAVFFPASWDTNDEGCRSVFNLISTMNTMDYKNHVWNQPTKALSEPVPFRMVTEPPSAVAVPWGYPKTNAEGELMLPLEVRTPKFELRDVFGNQLVDRNTTATFPVSYRWLADELALAYLAGPTTPCVTDITERDLLLYRSLFDFPLAPCPEKPERHKTVWWTLPYGRSLSSSTGTMEPVLATPSTVATGTRVNEDGTSANDAQATTGSTAILPNSSPLSSTLGVPTIISVEAQPSPSTSADTTSIGEPSAATGQDENLNPLTLQVHSISKGTGGEVVTQRPVPTSSAGANTSVNTKLTQTEGHNSPPEHVNAANGSTGTHETIITKTEKPGSASTSDPNTFLHLHSDETPVKMQTTVVSVFTVTSATGPIPPKETLFTEAEKSGVFSTSYHPNTFLVPDSDATPVKPQTTDVSALTWATRDDHTATAINNNKSGITRLPSPAATSSSTAATSNPPPNHSIRPAWGGPIPPDVQEKFSNLRSEADYLMVSLIPVLLATLVGIPVQIFVASLNAILPFRALVREHGAHVEQSLHLPRASWLAPLISYRFLVRFKDPLPFLGVMLETLATMLVPLSTETIRMEFTTMGCRRSKVRLRCAFGLRKVEAPIRVVEAVLITMAVLVVVMGCLLARWRTGLATEPWSIASMAGLLHSSEEEVHDLLRKIPKHGDEGKCLLDSEISGPFEGKRYRLGFYTSGNEELVRYGLYVVPAREDDSPVRPTVRDPKMREPVRPASKFKFWHMQPSARQIVTRLITLIFIVGLLVLILYYENTILDTPFERFMDSQSFGVRLLFTSFGTAVSGLWSYHFSQTAESQIYDRLVTPKPARESILLSPPSNVFTGLWRFSRTKDILSSNTSVAALVAKFTPILFSNIPFRNTVTWKMHETCTWMAVAVLSYMVVVLVGLLVWTSFGEKWGGRKLDLPVKVDTILGCMYYLVESRMVQDLEGVNMLARTARDRLVSEMGRLYVFVEVEKGDGRRMGVDYAASEARR